MQPGGSRKKLGRIIARLLAIAGLEPEIPLYPVFIESSPFFEAKSTFPQY
jgi:hypothetical protein